ncbi:MAG: hypothetical protein KDK51_04870 [Deltaproteobacteria bacterium]|nr:hypothetical protein [Deltaproteobacteria bacterium]
MNKFILLICICLVSFSSKAFEVKNQIALGVSQPYLINPDKHISDTTMVFSYRRQFQNRLFLNANMMLGLAGRHALRNQYGMGLNLARSSTFKPYASFNFLHEWEKTGNFGVSPRVGVEFDLSRLTNIYFVFLRVEIGWNFLFLEPARNEFDLYRISIGWGF